MQTTLCETFRSLAFRTFDQLGRARRVGHQPLEETFTDTNILELKDRHPTEIFCRTFTKHQEGVNGADWEWWLTDAGMARFLGLRVQAKVLHLTSNTFPHLHYRKRKTYQSAKFKRECAREGLVPLYCFYLHDQSGGLAPRPLCGSFAYVPESYGCALAPLSHVEKWQKGRETNDLTSVMAGVLPWHCLVCCSHYGGTSLPDRAWSFLQSVFDVRAARRKRLTPNNEGREQRPIIGPREDPPYYVRAILQGQEPEGRPDTVRGIVVVKGSERR